jgi:hypothetical protein
MPAWAMRFLKPFDLFLSYGHGIPGVDDSLPESEGGYSIWLSPTTTADIAETGQVREWVSKVAHKRARLTVRVDSALLNGTPAGATVDFVITVNGTPSAVAVTVPTGATADTTFELEAALAVDAGDLVGVAMSASQAMDDASTMRAEVEARLV